MLARVGQVRDVRVLERDARAATCRRLPRVPERVDAVSDAHRPGTYQTVDGIAHSAIVQMSCRAAVSRDEPRVRPRRQTPGREAALRRCGGTTGARSAFETGVRVSPVGAGPASGRSRLVLIRTYLIDCVADVSAADRAAVVETATKDKYVINNSILLMDLRSSKPKIINIIL